MTKNRVLVLLAAVAIFGVSWLASSGAVASAVPIPQEINVFLAGLIFSGVTAGFMWLFQYTGIDLRGFAEPISGTLSIWLLSELQGWVNLIPPQYDLFVGVAFQIIVVILTGLGTLHVFAKFRRSDSLLA